MLCVQSARFPIPTAHQAPKHSPIVEVALRALTELAISLALGAICCTFTTTPLILWGGMATQWLLNTAIRIVLAVTGKPQDNWLTALITALGALYNPQTLIHETGHKLAANCLLSKSNPTIALFPYRGGATRFHVCSATLLGKNVGLENIQPLISAAGPLLTLTISAILLAIAPQSSSYSPELSRLVIVATLINFLSHAIYAISAIWESPKNLANDFVVLKLAGLSPLIATIALIAIPLIILWSQSYFETPLRSESQSSIPSPSRISNQDLPLPPRSLCSC